MLKTQKEIIDRFMSDLKCDVIPNDMLPYLLCLTEDDRESIQWKQNQEGPRAAVLVLLQRLKRRPDSFEQFLTALKHTGCKHLKELLQTAVSEHVVITSTAETRNPGLQAPTIHIVTSPTAETMFLLKSPVIKHTVTSPTAETRSPGFQAPAIPTVTSPTAETTCSLETTSPMAETRNPLMSPMTEHTVTSPTAETMCPIKSPMTEHTVTSPTAETTCPIESPTTEHTVMSPTTETTCPIESPVTEHTVTSPTAETTCPIQSPTTEHTVTSPTAETTCPIKSPMTLPIAETKDPLKSPTTAHALTENVTSTMTETRSPTQANSASRETENCDYKYDIYICYCSEDRDTAQELRDVMKKEYHLNVCIDFIDFMPGAAISDNICNSIRNSKAIVFLLSPEFLDKKWARWELQHALHDSLIYHQKKMFPVLLKKCSIPKELELCHAIDLQGANKTVRAEGWKRLAAAVQGSRGSRSTLMEKFTSLMKLN